MGEFIYSLMGYLHSLINVGVFKDKFLNGFINGYRRIYIQSYE